jgi:hypothetical protein
MSDSAPVYGRQAISAAESRVAQDMKAKAMTVQKLKQKLENPFALIAQGFVAGTILFWATMPEESSAQPIDQSVAAVASVQPAQG